MTKKLISVIIFVFAAVAAVLCLASCHPEKFEQAGKDLVSKAEDYVIDEIKNPVSTTQPTTTAPTTVAPTAVADE